MPRYLCLLTYKGTSFYGWQKCKEGPSIESTLTEALQRLIKTPCLLQAASRTDRGVHAEGQVVTFDTTEEINIDQVHYALNSLLPSDISVQKVERASDTFHPSLDAIEKEYHYLVETAPIFIPFERDFYWHVPYPLDETSMYTGAKLLVGTHDFKAFTNVQQSNAYDETLRTLYSFEIEKKGTKLLFKIRGDRFLYRMARNLVGTLISIGRDKLALEDLPKLLKGALRCESGVTAPANGLVLKKIFYST
jgi:tRNA pseudouridine38-40 synthase